MSTYLRSSAFLILTGLGAIAAAVLVLVVGADTSPTTAETNRLFGIWRMRYIVLASALLLAGCGLLLAARSREAMFNFVLSMASICVTFIALEGVGQIGLVSWSALFNSGQGGVHQLGSKAVPNIDVEGSTKQDIAFAWGLQHESIPFRYKTDRLGYRNKIDRPSADIYLLGDSILVGALVPVDQIASTRLEKASKRSVTQLALIGLSPQAQHDLLWKANLDLTGKTVIQFIFEGNDLLDSRQFRTNRPVEKPEPQEGGLLIKEIWHILTSLTDSSVKRRNDANLCHIDEQKHLFLWTERSHAGHAEEARHITASLDEFRAKVERSGGRFAIVFVPTKYRVLADLCTFDPKSKLRNRKANLTPLRTHMRTWSETSGTAMLDLTAPLQTAAKNGRIPWFWGDTHWNATGHDIAASEVARWDFLNN